MSIVCGILPKSYRRIKTRGFSAWAYHPTKRNGSILRPNLASDQHGLFARAVHQSGNGSRLRVEVLHLGSVPKIVDGNLAPGVTKDELAFPEVTSCGSPPGVLVCLVSPLGIRHTVFRGRLARKVDRVEIHALG